MSQTTAPRKQHSSPLVTLPSPAFDDEFWAPAADSITIDQLTMVFEPILSQLFPSRGLMLLDAKGRLLQSNPKARLLCKTLYHTSNPTLTDEDGNLLQGRLPSEIERLAQCLIESHQLFPGERIQLQDEIFRSDQTRIQIQAGWITLGAERLCIMVTLEDLTEIAHQRALFDAFRFRFTERESDVWKLCLQGLSYRQIGTALFISINTVKRHIRSINAKRNCEVDV